jgi:hydrogenase 3 maturation protease
LLDSGITGYFKALGYPLLIITIGNSLRGDDGVGPYIASKLKNLPKGFILLDAGDRPEDIITGAVDCRPARTIIIDAADFGGIPGEARFIPDNAIPQTPLSTHSFPLPVITSILRQDTGSEVRFLGIQAEFLGFGEVISPEVLAAADEIIALITGFASE